MSFEDVMMKRLAACHAEACKEILAGVKSGRSLSDAVSDTIEALPASKSRDLRRWLRDWEAWEGWQKWSAQGWRIKKSGSSIYLYSPKMKFGMERLTDGPTNAETAAGAGVSALKYVGDSTGHGNWTRPAGWRYDDQALS